MTYTEIETMLRTAEHRHGELHGELNRCGPKGNRSVEQRMDYWRGRADALAAVLATMRPAAPERTLADVATPAGADFPGWDKVDEEWSP